METIDNLSGSNSNKLQYSMDQIPSVRSKAIMLGFWAALLTAIFTVLFVITTFIFLPPTWEGIQSYSKSFNSLQLVSVIPCMIFALTNVILMISLHYYFPEHQRIFSLTGLHLPLFMRPLSGLMPICSFLFCAWISCKGSWKVLQSWPCLIHTLFFMPFRPLVMVF